MSEFDKAEMIETLRLQTSVNQRTKEVNVKASSYNLKRIVEHFGHDVFAKNTMGARLDLLKHPWFETDEFSAVGYPREVTDVDITRIQQWISEQFEVDFTTQQIKECTWSEAEKHPYNPARNWLESLQKWDGVARFDKLVKLLKVDEGAEIATRFTLQQFMLNLIGVTYATLETPCNPQTVLIFQGEQGCGKSRFFRALFPKKYKASWLHEKPWCSEGGDAGERYNRSMVNAWIDVDSECEQMVRSSTQSLKSWTTTNIESFRPLYRSAIRVPRWFVIAGCTNQEQILRDETGARRWNIIKSRATEEDPIDNGAISEMSEQLWAEAFHVFCEQFHRSVDSLNQALWYNKEFWGAETVEAVKEHMNTVRTDAYQEDVLERDVLEYCEENADRARPTELENPILVKDIILSISSRSSIGDKSPLIGGSSQLAARRIEMILTRNGYRKGRGTGSKGKTGWRKSVYKK